MLKYLFKHFCFLHIIPPELFRRFFVSLHSFDNSGNVVLKISAGFFEQMFEKAVDMDNALDYNITIKEQTF